jgi:outer membrane immunogenic protein
MKKVLLALTALAAFTGSAVAADLPVRTKAAPVAVAPVPTWTGFWLSGGFGFGMMENSHSVNGPVAPFPSFDFGHDNGGKGWLGKVGLGYDYQFMGNFVIGAFADAQWTSIAGWSSFNCPAGCLGPTGYMGSLKNDWSWSIGGRAGYVALPGLLTYFNGGFSQGNFNQVNYIDAATTGATGLVLPSQRMNGYFLGGGTEYAISQIPGLFWKSEVRFYDYGNRTSSQLCVLTGPCGAAGTIHSIDHSHVYEQTATTEFVYRFNWGSPIVAKY